MPDDYPELWPDDWPLEAITLIEVAEEERDELRTENAKLRKHGSTRLNEVVVLRSTNKELRATIAKLDKTADGVPVVPGLEYWFYSPGLSKIIHSCVHETDAYDKCYSTKEAAEAAKNEGK